MHTIEPILKRLSSKSVMARKQAVKELARHLSKDYLARLSLHYVAVHDPSYTVRNVARQAFYRIGEPPSSDVVWDKAYLF